MVYTVNPVDVAELVKAIGSMPAGQVLKVERDENIHRLMLAVWTKAKSEGIRLDVWFDDEFAYVRPESTDPE